MILITGFGPFGSVVDNPSARLAEQVDGRRIGSQVVIGRVLPVDWATASAQLQQLVAEHAPVFALGLGVAMNRTEVTVEAQAGPAAEGIDVAGHSAPEPEDDRAVWPARVNAPRLAELLQARVSLDAGAYLCNHWLKILITQTAVPGTFVHVPPQGMRAERLLDGLAAYLDAEATFS